MTRILVEKKEPFQTIEKEMLLEIRDVLNIPGITRVRIFNGYDVTGVENIDKAIGAVFSEAAQDDAYITEPDLSEASHFFAVAAAIDQYDQREDYANQLLKILETGVGTDAGTDSDAGVKPSVNVFKVFVLYGEITEAELVRIKAYFINPLEMRELPQAKQDGLLGSVLCFEVKPRVYSQPDSVEKIEGFSNADDALLKVLADKYSIAMAIDNLKLCSEYFAKENRDPTVTEMKVLDTYWSDHCRHSTFMTELDKIEVEDNKYAEGLKRAQDLLYQSKSYVYGDEFRPLCLMDIATMEMKKLKKCGILDDLEKSDEVNACSIEVSVPVDGKQANMIVMFKNETHNHPTEMEPFGGASTCLGGAIRDPLSGRAYVYGAIRVTGSADPREPVKDTLTGKLPQRKITQTAAEGYSSYGNGIGLPLGHLAEYYDHGFKAKRMECGAVVAAAEKADIVRGRAESGDVVVLIGGRTGRDGCGGATGSSKEHDDGSLEKGGAEVQKGNPVIERNIVRLFRKPTVSRMIKICNDFGAGGVCVAVGELADGLDINLDNVTVKYSGLDGTELAISESQERMAVVIDRKDLDAFLAEATAENLEASKIAEVTDNGRVVMKWKGDEILNLTSDFLNSGGVRQKTNVKVSALDWSFADGAPEDGKMGGNAGIAADGDIKSAWLSNLSDLNVCSKQGLTSRFDSTTGGGTVFMPYGGVNQKTPEQGLAMRIPLREGETDYGTLMTVGYNPSLGNYSPFHAAMYAVIESVMKIVAMGGDFRKVRLSFQEYFERLTTEESWGKPYAALMGAFLAQDELQIAAIGGKDSMSGTFNDINVPPSLLSFALAVEDTTKLISRAFKRSGNKVYLLKTPIDDSGIPNFKTLRQNMSSVYALIGYGQIKSASVVGAGGIAAAVSEMAFGNGIGLLLDPDFKDNLFMPQYASLIIELEVTPKDDKGLRDDYILLGTTTDSKCIEVGGVQISLDEALNAWESPLNTVFPIPDIQAVESSNNAALGVSVAENSGIKVLIPIFPGSIGEYELEKQFRKAGADIETVLFRTLTPTDVEKSYKELTDAINRADIFAIPSGLTAGAEPDGSAKLIAMIMRHPGVKNALNKLISERKGLVLGIGEGFKALLKTGAIQTGLVQDKECDLIAYAKNPTNKYHCTLKSVKIEQTQSPWLKDMGGTTEIVPVSGYDGTIYMPDELYDEFAKNGQIASVYETGKPVKGTVLLTGYTVEAMVSENGLVLGRVGLAPNMGKGLYTNVISDAVESKIFTNAVNYILSGR